MPYTPERSPSESHFEWRAEHHAAHRYRIGSPPPQPPASTRVHHSEHRRLDVVVLRLVMAFPMARNGCVSHHGDSVRPGAHCFGGLGESLCPIPRFCPERLNRFSVSVSCLTRPARNAGGGIGSHLCGSNPFPCGLNIDCCLFSNSYNIWRQRHHALSCHDSPSKRARAFSKLPSASFSVAS